MAGPEGLNASGFGAMGMQRPKTLSRTRPSVGRVGGETPKKLDFSRERLPLQLRARMDLISRPTSAGASTGGACEAVVAAPSLLQEHKRPWK